MKDPQLKQIRSKLNKPIEEIDEITPEEEITHQLIEALSDKIDDMNLFISQTQALITQSALQDNTDFRSCSTSSPTCQNTASYSVINNANYSISSYITPITSTDSVSSTDSNCNNETDENRIGGAAGSKKVNPQVILLGSSNYEYSTQDTTNYRYGFTNSEFFAFIGGLDPVEYILVITVISILLATQLNTNEQQLIGGALIDIGVTMGNIVEQTLFQQARQNEIATAKRQASLQQDMSNIYQSLVMLQQEINELRDELHLD